MHVLLQTCLWVTVIIMRSHLVNGDNDPLSYNCPESSYLYSSGSEFQGNLNYTLSRLLEKASQSGFANFTNGTGVDQVYGLYYCTGDIDHQACQSCVQSGVNKVIQLCKSLKQGIVWYRDCTLRYANSSIFSQEKEAPVYNYYNYTSNVSAYILDPYRDKFESTMQGLINEAANDEGYATTLVNLSSSMSLRGLVQCTPDIIGAPCYRCLSTGLRLMDLWSNTMMFLPSCQVRFDIYGSPPLIPPNNPPRHLSVGYVILIVLLSAILVSSLLGGFWFWKRQRIPKDPLIQVTRPEASIPEDDIPEPSERGRVHGLARFTYSQVEEMTNWFTRKLGEGGYAVVYYGCLPDPSSREVAVKVLSKNDAPKQFSTEIDVFGRISHKNLVSLIGYCEEGTHLALIYEYMARGDLKVLLESADSLTWKNRLEIAIDTAQGLDYLHNGCSPPIVHRDVKPANILLNQDLRAKVADFGFSKIFPDEYVSNLSTRVVGTPGYLDPQYNLTGQLNEKGDVYSFGVVMLELITGRTAVSRYTNLVHWVKPLIESADIGNILDPKLREDVDENYTTIWKATELSMKCVNLEAAHRPTMSQIVTELKECLAMEKNVQVSNTASPSMEMVGALMTPTPR